MARASRALSRSQRALALLLLVVAGSLLVGTVVLSVSMLAQTRDLNGKVQITEGIVDANVRTLSQVQRELLRLDVLLQQERPDPAKLTLQSALVSQRVQEGTLSYQSQTLGTDELLAQSRSLARQWRATVPLIARSRGTDAAAIAARDRLVNRIESLERGYNQLVSDGEINRKVKAGQANASTRILLTRAQRLLMGLILTFVAVGVLFVLTGFAYRHFHRQREAANADLVTLNQELQRYAHVVRATDNMVVVTDRLGRVEWVNASFERTTGYRLVDIVGRTPGELLQGPGTDPEVVARMSQHVRAGQSFTEEVLNHGQDGREYWVSLEVSPMHDDDGRLTGFVAVEADITERRRSEELLRAAKEAAEDTAREKTNFLATMSHEIRTPLNAVLGFTDLLLLTELDPRQREYVRSTHNSGRLLLELVNDILDFSALEAGRVESEQRVFPLETTLHDVVGMFEPEARRRGLSLGFHLYPGLPACVRGDETRLRQVLVNLIGNGLKFTEHGSVNLTVGAAPSGPGETRLRLAVTDTGIGIPADRLPRLFQPFTQVDASTTRRFGGTGLGLAICRLLVERMGGRIDVTSDEGEGSTFTVELTLATAGPEELPTDAASDAAADVSSLQVLLAEDDRVNQTVAVHMLRRLGIEPVVVADGGAAVQAAISGRFDVVLMDVHMPTMDGVEATAAIRAALPAALCPRIVAVTANALDGDRERLLAAGMDDYLSKPVRLQDLSRALGRGVQAPAPPLAPVVEQPPVDVGHFVEQSGIEEIGFLDELLSHLVSQTGELVVRGPDLLAAGDLQELQSRAHSISGAASYCAAEPLRAAASDLEVACRSGDLTSARTDFARLLETSAALVSWTEGREPAPPEPAQ